VDDGNRKDGRFELRVGWLDPAKCSALIAMPIGGGWDGKIERAGAYEDKEWCAEVARFVR